MEAFLSSTLAVAIAEIGDKTQLLALFLVTKYGRPYVISFGVLLSTLLNHALSAWVGAWLGDKIPAELIPWIISASFVAVAIWLLVPDKEDDDLSKFSQYGPLVATCVLFFLAEIGDKTQIATVILAAQYQTQVAWVIAGTTFGMLIANVPVIFAGKWLMQRIPLKLAHRCAFVLFLLLAFATIAKAYLG
ncbi:UPF0016 family membrane protein [Cellvibrio zantedeschiae]|uniref:GDT1 family protein n=2 Tax=Cellvibrio zantedeschiae TaxID=1237077 RepID=A0ABQ3AXK0_9GAMM|nr:UPF0016 family membrane protein [Cellvibrio zantedeschiae]